MVRRCSDKLAKMLMVVFNGVFLVCGIAILVLGLSNVSFDGHVKTIVAGLSGVNIAIILVGAVIFLISFMGFYGAWRENSCLITSFMFCMIVILIAEVVVAGMALANRDELKGVVEKGLRETVHLRHNNTMIDNSWNDMEISLKCCGADGPSDYAGQSFPRSCCTHKVEVCRKDDKSFNERPCIPQLEAFLENQYLGFGVAAIVVAFIEVVGIIFSCCLRSAINERYETV